MKKLFLMLAVAGLIASCTGNGNTSGSASGSDSISGSVSGSGEAKDTEKTEAKAEKDTIKGPVTIENPSWTVDVPEGWYVAGENKGSSQKSGSYVRLQPLERPQGVFGITEVKINSYPYKSNTVEQSQNTFKSAFKVDNPVKGQETIGGMKFAKLVKPAEKSTNCPLTHLSAPLTPEGNITIEVFGYDIKDPVIKGMLDSFKLKPAEAEAK